MSLKSYREDGFGPFTSRIKVFKVAIECIIVTIKNFM